MKTTDRLTIVVATDTHFLVMLAALIKSIEAHLKKVKKVHFYVVAEDINQDNKLKLEKSVNKEITSIEWLTMKEVIPEGFQLPLDRSSFPLIVYMRLFIPYFLPKEIERALYMDVDMMLLTDIANLFETDLHGKPIAAVQDPRVLTFDCNWGGVKNYKELNFPAKSKYFNSGLVLMDTEVWRQGNYTEKVVNNTNDNITFANYPDQYGLNITFVDNWEELDLRWNHFAPIDPVKEPYLVHFVERKPIYKAYSYNKSFKESFYKYVEQTQWKGFRPIGESARYVKKIKNVLQKVFKKVRWA